VVHTKRTVKADPTALVRSAIRRQPTVRHLDHSNPGHLNRGPRLSPGSLDILRRDHESTRRDREQTLPPPEWTTEHPGDFEDSTAGLDGLVDTNDRRRERNGGIFHSNVPVYGEILPPMREGMPRAVPAAQDTLDHDPIEVSERPYVEQRMSPPPQYPPQYMLNPSYLSADLDEGPLPMTLLAPPRASTSAASAPRTSSLTRRFAPAYYLPNLASDEARSRYHDARPPRRSIRRLAGTLAGHARYDDYLNDRASQLRRYRAIRASRARAHDQVPAAMTITPSDGLGDRRRSFSPEEDTWETLLTTITPDERLPSASSSFTSASAAASASASTSSLSFNSSTRPATTGTTPSTTSQSLNSLSNICDDPTDSDYSDFDPSTDYLDVPRRVPYENSLRNLDDPPTPGPRRYHANTQARTRRASQEMSDHFSRMSPGRLRERNTELDHRQILRIEEILSRMDRHEPIPEEWWATAGLGRSVGGRNDRIDRERL
jgi:hypothetical protein